MGHFYAFIGDDRKFKSDRGPLWFMLGASTPKPQFQICCHNSSEIVGIFMHSLRYILHSGLWRSLTIIWKWIVTKNWLYTNRNSISSLTQKQLNQCELSYRCPINNQLIKRIPSHLLCWQLFVFGASVEMKHFSTFLTLGRLHWGHCLGPWAHSQQLSAAASLSSLFPQPGSADESTVHSQSTSGATSELYNTSTQDLIVLWGVFGAINRFQ